MTLESGFTLNHPETHQCPMSATKYCGKRPRVLRSCPLSPNHRPRQTEDLIRFRGASVGG
jgi:hypothetical protein